jgi:hypothetical protein
MVFGNQENDYNLINTSHSQEDYSAPFSGYLHKRSSSGQWQKRFFEINGKYLIYYKNESMEKILAAVSIPQLGDIKVNGEMVDEIGKGVVFQIDLKNKHYYLRADTFDLAEQWVRHLLFTRDGLLNLDELRAALNNSTPPNKKQQPRIRKSTVSSIGSIYNPTHSIHLPHGVSANSSTSAGNTHNQDIEPSSYSSGTSSNEYLDETDLIESSQMARSRRQSDTTWQKAHRSFMSCCIRC